MRSFFVLATLALAAKADTKVFPAGVDPLACPNYPFCGQTSPADFPTPVVNGQPIAPILNTTPEQTAFWQKVKYCLEWSIMQTQCVEINYEGEFLF